MEIPGSLENADVMNAQAGRGAGVGRRAEASRDGNTGARTGRALPFLRKCGSKLWSGAKSVAKDPRVWGAGLIAVGLLAMTGIGAAVVVGIGLGLALVGAVKKGYDVYQTMRAGQHGRFAAGLAAAASVIGSLVGTALVFAGGIGLLGHVSWAPLQAALQWVRHTVGATPLAERAGEAFAAFELPSVIASALSGRADAPPPPRQPAPVRNRVSSADIDSNDSLQSDVSVVTNAEARRKLDSEDEPEILGRLRAPLFDDHGSLVSGHLLEPLFKKWCQDHEVSAHEMPRYVFSNIYQHVQTECRAGRPMSERETLDFATRYLQDNEQKILRGVADARALRDAGVRIDQEFDRLVNQVVEAYKLGEAYVDRGALRQAADEAMDNLRLQENRNLDPNVVEELVRKEMGKVAVKARTLELAEARCGNDRVRAEDYRNLIPLLSVRELPADKDFAALDDRLRELDELVTRLGDKLEPEEAAACAEKLTQAHIGMGDFLTASFCRRKGYTTEEFRDIHRALFRPRFQRLAEDPERARAIRANLTAAPIWNQMAKRQAARNSSQQDLRDRNLTSLAVNSWTTSLHEIETMMEIPEAESKVMEFAMLEEQAHPHA